MEKSILWESIRQKARDEGREEGEAKGLRTSLRQIVKSRFPDANPAAADPRDAGRPRCPGSLDSAGPGCGLIRAVPGVAIRELIVEDADQQLADWEIPSLLTDEVSCRSRLLEGWNVEKSILWESIRQKAREEYAEGYAEGFAEGFAGGFAKGLRTSIRLIVKARFPDANPAAGLQVIETQADPDILNRWIQRAVLADSFEQFQASLSAN